VRQFVKFGIVGASGFVVNLVAFTIVQFSTPVALQAARYPFTYSFSFLLGGLSNYILNRIWTFRSEGHAVVQGFQFIGVSIAALVVALFVSHLVTPYLGPGHRTWFVATVSGMFVNFFANKYWTFRDSG
ncbi:MAG: GtrA family protein, partial [Vulcanimicrobiaceae bacterium]